MQGSRYLRGAAALTFSGVSLKSRTRDDKLLTYVVDIYGSADGVPLTEIAQDVFTATFNKFAADDLEYLKNYGTDLFWHNFHTSLAGKQISGGLINFNIPQWFWITPSATP